GFQRTGLVGAVALPVQHMQFSGCRGRRRGADERQESGDGSQSNYRGAEQAPTTDDHLDYLPVHWPPTPAGGYIVCWRTFIAAVRSWSRAVALALIWQSAELLSVRNRMRANIDANRSRRGQGLRRRCAGDRHVARAALGQGITEQETRKRPVDFPLRPRRPK